MKKKLIKKYLQGSLMTPAWSAPTFEDLPTRKYYWKLWTPEMKVKTDYYTGEPLDERWKVLVDDLGNIVDTSNPQVLADYAALSDSGNFIAAHPGVTFTFDKDTNQKFVLPTTETADERIERLSNAPIATQELWEKIKQKEDKDRQIQTLEGHKIWVHQKDKEAKAKTPGVGALFVVPTLLGAGTAMGMANPLAFFTSLGGAKVGEVTLNYPFLDVGYKSFGDWWLGPNASEGAKQVVNLGTWLGGGAGYSTAKIYQAAVENLAKRFGTKWAAKSLSTMYPAYNPYPQLVAEVPAIEISSAPLRSSKSPGVFFTKAGEANEGSVVGTSGNWQIKALMPGNALERKVAADGTVSWNDFDWYLKLKPVEPNDRIHLKVASEQFPKDKPIPYEELKKVSSDMIPKFTKTNSENLKGYGLDQLGYGHDSGTKEHYGTVVKIDPNEGVNAESVVFNNNNIGAYDGGYTGGRVHFPDATQHMRGFTLDNEPNVYYVTEIQSDFFQLGMKHNEFRPGTIQEHMAETTLLRGIQEAMLHAASLGKSVVRFPTPETVIKIQYYKPELTLEGLKLAYRERAKFRAALNDFVDSEYPEVNELRMLEIDAEMNYDTANAKVKDYWRSIHPEELNDVRFWLIKAKDDIRTANGAELELAKVDPEFRNLLTDKEKALKVFLELDKARTDALQRAEQDPRYIQILTEGKLKVLQIINDYTQISKGRQNIINKYKAFPKHFRRLFGDKPEIRNITDSKGNTWFEVDVPEDINTRNLLFSKVGEINRGSTMGSYRKFLKDLQHFSLKDLQNEINSGNLKTKVRDAIRNIAADFKEMRDLAKANLYDKRLKENFESGNYENLPTEFLPIVQLGVDSSVLDEIIKNTVGRRLLAYNKEYDSAQLSWLEKKMRELEKLLLSTLVLKYPRSTFSKTGNSKVKGFVNPFSKRISMPTDIDPLEKFFTLTHEVEHITDWKLPLTPNLLMALNLAYDENFLELPNRLRYPILWRYSIYRDASTTNGDARRFILNNHNMLDASIEDLNTFIDSLSDKETFDAVENANGYGSRYIDWLRRNKKLTPEKAELFRQAMIVCAKVGDVNEGSVINLLKSFRFPKRINENNFMDFSLEEIEEAIYSAVRGRQWHRAKELNDFYQRKLYDGDLPLSKVEEVLPLVPAKVVSITPENIKTLSAGEVDNAYKNYAISKDFVGAAEARKLFKETFPDKANIPITFENKEIIPDIIWDIQYFDALENNPANATRLRALHFLSKSPNNLLRHGDAPITYFHASDAPQVFTQFNPAYVGKEWKESKRFNRPAAFFTPGYHLDYWGSNFREFYLNSERPAINSDPLDEAVTLHLLSTLNNSDSAVRHYLVNGKKRQSISQGPQIITEPLNPTLEVAMFDFNKIKLKDTVTKEGENVIPLSWRDDFNVNNILYNKIGNINKGSTVGVSRRPILRKNMHEFSDAEWDAAYKTALERGNKQEMWRLLTLRFQQKTKEYIATLGGDVKPLLRGEPTDFTSFRDEGVWLTDDNNYALNFTVDPYDFEPTPYPPGVKRYFVKGSSEQLLPESILADLPLSEKDNYNWEIIAQDLIRNMLNDILVYPGYIQDLFVKLQGQIKGLKSMVESGKITLLDVINLLNPVSRKRYKLGNADVIIGHDKPMKQEGPYKYWNNSLGTEYYVKNPNYVKSADLITYDDNGNIIPLSLRFNFGRNDRRYGWLLPLTPFLYPNKKDQAN